MLNDLKATRVGFELYAVYLKIRKRFHHNPTYRISKALSTKNAVVVQIGSSDGITGDPIFALLKTRRHWKAILVEPLPGMFGKLKENYKNMKNVIFENVAINDGRQQTFYWIDDAIENDYPQKSLLKQIGSFDKDHVVKFLNQIDDGIKRYLRQAEIQGIQLPVLLEKYRINNIDVFHVDAEGYDYKILSQLDLDQYKPKVILFEHIHLSQNEKNQALNLLSPSYEIEDLGSDFFCTLT